MRKKTREGWQLPNLVNVYAVNKGKGTVRFPSVHLAGKLVHQTSLMRDVDR
jgi:hypothetical protein